MFSRPTGPIRRLGVRYTAQSKKKRIDVQLLKNFAGLGVRGQVVRVKPSTMINRLHPHGGAVYLNYTGAKPTIPVVEMIKEQQQDANQGREGLTKSAAGEAKSKKSYSPDELLSLDDLVKIDLSELISTDKQAIFSKVPTKLVIRRETTNKALNKPISTEPLLRTLQGLALKEMSRDDVLRNSVSALFDAAKLKVEITQENGITVTQLDSLGQYQVTVSDANEQLANITVTVSSSNER